MNALTAFPPAPEACLPERSGRRDRQLSRHRAVMRWLTLQTATLTVTLANLSVFGATGLWWIAAPLLAVLATGLALHPMMKRRAGVPVLVWHSVSDRPGWLPWASEISVRPESFSSIVEVSGADDEGVDSTSSVVSFL